MEKAGAPVGREPAQFIDPFDNRALLGYFYDIAQWHGYLRFLGLPQLRENPDQPLQELFVEPNIRRSIISSDRPSSTWREEIQPALQAVLENPRIVLLGDPGSGKSTLVSFIACQLSQPRSSRWQASLGPLVPIPMVLRELKLDEKPTGDRLIEAFLDHAVANKLRPARQMLIKLLEAGQGFFLLDGLDEIGNVEVRKALRESVLELSLRFPECRFLLTSRIVGYEEVPFHQQAMEQRFASDLQAMVYIGKKWAELCYIAPFSDFQIEQFARSWYARREVAEELRVAGARDFIAAVHGSESTLRLARIPNLLTLMALIHRVHRRLPHGRVLLFDKIAEAYLESIDAFRGIQEVDYSLAQKRRWLAYVGFRMQWRRSEAKGSLIERDREVLVDQRTVQTWLLEAMHSSGRGVNAGAAQTFLNYIGRRSGLLLPRGEGLFAFTHLSFQEYFAACYLAEQVSSPRWLLGRAALGTSPLDLYDCATQVEWHETLVLLFELLADRPDWLEVVSEAIFGVNFCDFGASSPNLAEVGRCQLLAEVSIDPYSGLSYPQRLSAWEACWRLEILRQESQRFALDTSMIARRLAEADEGSLSDIWEIFCRVANELKPTRLSLSGLSGLSAEKALWALGEFRSLQILDLGRSLVADLSPLVKHQRLEWLDLSHTAVADLIPLAGLGKLEHLYLIETMVSDIRPLSKLRELRSLNIAGTQVVDLGALAKLRKLERLCISVARISREQIRLLSEALPALKIILW